jgi:hypothetical protein
MNTIHANRTILGVRDNLVLLRVLLLLLLLVVGIGRGDVDRIFRFVD